MDGISYICTAVSQFLYLVKRFIVISKGTEMLRVPPERLVYISADGNYSNVHTQDGRHEIVSFQLGQIEDMIGNQLGDDGNQFIRLGRGFIINMDYVHLIDVSLKRLVLSDCAGFYQELEPSREVLIKLKAYLEATAGND